MTANEDWDRLANYVRTRRTELRLTQKGVQDMGGPSSAKVREIENRRTTTLSMSKRRDLERALKWTGGSVDAILRGEEPGLKRWRNEGVGIASLIPNTTIDDLPRVEPSDIEHGLELSSASRQIDKAIQELGHDDHAQALDTLIGARATLSLVITDLNVEVNLVPHLTGEPNDLSAKSTTEGRASETPEGKKNRGGGSPPLADDSEEGPILRPGEDLPGLREETPQQRRKVQ